MGLLRILIVDDHESVRSGIRSLLASRPDFFVCGEAKNGIEALEKTKQFRPDVVLMDISMPQLDGLQATRIIRREFPESQVVIISQNDPATVREQIVQLDAADFVAKSDLSDSLLPTLDRLFGQRLTETESEQRLRVAIKAARLGTWELDLADDRLTSSAQCKAHYGRASSDLFEFAAFKAAIHPRDQAQILGAIERAVNGLGEYATEYRCVWPDGTIRWINARALVIHGEDGKPLRMVGVTQDITSRKAAEVREQQLAAETAEAVAKFRAVFDQSSVFAGILTLEGVVIEANQMCLEACGYRAEEVIGRAFWDTPWWSKSKEVQKKIRGGTKQAAEGLPYQEQLPYHWADGTERVVDFSLHPIRDGQGNIIFLHPTGVDVTQRRLSEDRILKLTESLEVEVGFRTKQLEDRNSDVLRQSKLLRVLSQRLIEFQDAERRRIARELHDSAGQLLAALSMNLASISNQVSADAPALTEKTNECKQLVEQITREIRTMSYLLHPPLLEEVGLSAALPWYVKGLAERSGMEITLDIQENFGRLPGELELAVFRVVQECLTNIHRHSGSKTANIRLFSQDDQAFLEVRDQGKGIPPQKLAEIQTHGSGVGIQGIRERLRPFDGKMNIDSGDSGTTICVSFPVPAPQAFPQSVKIHTA